jgi:hypothetical protein
MILDRLCDRFWRCVGVRSLLLRVSLRACFRVSADALAGQGASVLRCGFLRLLHGYEQ